MPKGWRDGVLGAKWQRLRELRRVVTGAIELARAGKVIGASLQAAPTLYLGAEDQALAATVDMAELSITSDLTIGAIEAAPSDAFRIEEVKGVAVFLCQGRASALRALLAHAGGGRKAIRSAAVPALRSGAASRRGAAMSARRRSILIARSSPSSPLS